MEISIRCYPPHTLPLLHLRTDQAALPGKQRDVQGSRCSQQSPCEGISNRALLLDLLRVSTCMDCGLADLIVLEFDHREAGDNDPK